MKRIFTSLSILLLGATQQITAQEQLDNGGFENWETVTVKDSLHEWISSPSLPEPLGQTFFKSDEGVTGSAVLLQSLEVFEGGEISVGNLVLANTFTDDLPTGYPYTDFVSTFNAHLKYDFAEGDTGFVAVILQSGGFPYSYGQFPVYGTQETWESFSWELPDALVAPENIIIAFSSGGYNDTEPIGGSWLMVDDISFGAPLGTPADLPNHDFEDWTSIEIEQATSWNSLDIPVHSVFNMHNTSKTTTATEGDYALKITTHPINIEEDIPAFITNGRYNFEEEEIWGGSPFTGMPEHFKGKYQFISSTDSDTGAVYLRFWNADGDQQEYLDILSPQADWTEFSIPLSLPFTPDSVLVAIFGGQLAGDELILDNTRFTYNSVGIDENNALALTTFPNPANTQLNITVSDATDLSIADLNGRQVYYADNVNGTLNVSTADWAEGLYIVQSRNSDYIKTERIIIQH